MNKTGPILFAILTIILAPIAIWSLVLSYQGRTSPKITIPETEPNPRVGTGPDPVYFQTEIEVVKSVKIGENHFYYHPHPAAYLAIFLAISACLVAFYYFLMVPYIPEGTIQPSGSPN